jgi:hypothetical protein
MRDADEIEREAEVVGIVDLDHLLERRPITLSVASASMRPSRSPASETASAGEPGTMKGCRRRA